MDSVREKAVSIFRELAGDRADRLTKSTFEIRRPLIEALAKGHYAAEARDIAFHMTDWNSDAAFIAAVLLFPERFTSEEIQSGIESFLIHAPNHVAAAAKLHRFPIQDIFDVGALNGETNEGENDLSKSE